MKLKADKQTGGRRKLAHNSTYKKLAVQCSADIPIAIGMVKTANFL